MDLLLAVYLSPLLSNTILAQCSGHKTVTTNLDAESINQCDTFDGDIVIDAEALGDIYLNGIETINGNLTVVNATSLTSLTADNITSIGGSLQLSSCPLLNSFNFPLLEQVQSLTWTDLPVLQGLSLDAGLTAADAIYISETGLINLSGISPAVIDTLDINNNPALETVDFNQLVNVTGGLSFQANAPNIIVTLASLQFVYGDFASYNISGLSVPDLQNVTGSFTCYSCTMSTFKATWLQVVGRSLEFVSTDLQTLDFPVLAYIGGGLQLSDNTQLAAVSGFPMLDTVDGPMLLNGVFASVGFASLGSVQGDVSIETTNSNGTICDVFKDLHTNQVINGSVDCQTSVSDSVATDPNVNFDSGTNPTDTSDNTTTSADSPTTLSTGAIAGIVIGALALLACLGLAIFFSLRRRRTHQPTHPPSGREFDRLSAHAQLPATQHGEKAELYVDPRAVAEMKGQDSPVAELDGQCGRGNGQSAKQIPGVHEADGGSHVSPIGAGRGGVAELFSPVSPVDATATATATGNGTKTKTASTSRETS